MLPAAAAQAAAALPTPALHHVGLNVVDPAKSQQFYKTMWPQGEITYPDLGTHVPRLRKEGVKILENIHTWGGTRAAMIEDLDGVAIMLVERTAP